MPHPDDNELELDPSTGSEILDEAAQPPEGSEAAAAESSPAEGVTEAKDTLSIVRDVVDAHAKPEAEAVSPAEGEEAGEEPGDPKKQDDEDYSDVPFNKHPRFQRLVQERKAFKVDAERYNHVQTFLDQRGISPEQAAQALSITGLMRTDPAQAWKELRPLVQQLLVAAGEVLPDDLTQRVQAGELSPDAAHEVSRARAQVQSVQQRQSFEQQQAERQRTQQVVSELTSAATTWEQDRRTKDPNFDAKLEPLMKELLWMQQQEGKPATRQGVVGQLTRAYKTVNERFAPAAPVARPAARPALRPVTGGQVSGKPQPNTKEMSTLDIIERRLAARG
jgi:hypothetical protein